MGNTNNSTDRRARLTFANGLEAAEALTVLELDSLADAAIEIASRGLGALEAILELEGPLDGALEWLPVIDLDLVTEGEREALGAFAGLE